MKILLVEKNNTFADFAAAFGDQAEVQTCTSAAEALRLVEGETFDAVCVGEELEDASGLEFAHTLTRKFPLTNCALVSGDSPEDFHEETEGLGILMQIKPKPDAAEVARLLIILRSITNLF
ncbi:hypothetical protein JWG39_05645 [Desulforhopalus vacuolatus]|uniref:hypothetical protein n=1 Tax=Desulforhopalus vacuolatus TaxID=40414 RepID=UPI001963B3A7|nr:hypothetical protein [Desulforhopalus vacuolatus]MBM9519305.1 hypothetical protein [Desulforhopalus vacuolatus]